MPDNVLQYTAMPFWQSNAPATFQHLMYCVLSGIRNSEACFNGVVIYSASWSKHLKTLSHTFNRFCETSLTLNLAKCEFGKATVTYLDKRVGQGQVRVLGAVITTLVKPPFSRQKRYGAVRLFSLPRVLHDPLTASHCVLTTVPGQ